MHATMNSRGLNTLKKKKKIHTDLTNLFLKVAYNFKWEKEFMTMYLNCKDFKMLCATLSHAFLFSVKRRKKGKKQKLILNGT